MQLEALNTFFWVSGLIVGGIMIIMAIVYVKTGRLTPPVRHLREIPTPLIIVGLIGLVLGIGQFATTEPIKDQDGFGIALFQLNDPEAHGLSLLRDPSPDSPSIRTVERFESFTVSGKEMNGFIQVKMAQDDRIGWLREDIAAPPSLSTAMKKLITAIRFTAKDFATALFNWRAFIEIVAGVAVGGIFVGIFGHRRGERYTNKIDIAIMVVAAIAALLSQMALRKLVPYSGSVAAIEAAYSNTCIWIQHMLPTMVAAFLANTLFGRCSRAHAVGESILGFLCIFLLYVAWGSLAGWW